MLNNRKIWCNGQLIEVSYEVYLAYTKADRKEKYFTVDIKSEHIIIDQKSQTSTVRPSREDSLDRLMDDNAQQFPDATEQVEEVAIWNVLSDELHKAITKLSPEEQELIQALYFEGYTERSWSKHTGIPPMTIHYRKVNILTKLKNILK